MWMQQLCSGSSNKPKLEAYTIPRLITAPGNFSFAYHSCAYSIPIHIHRKKIQHAKMFTEAELEEREPLMKIFESSTKKLSDILMRRQ